MQSRIITRGKVEILEHEPPIKQKTTKTPETKQPKSTPETKDTKPKEPKVEQ